MLTNKLVMLKYKFNKNNNFVLLILLTHMKYNYIIDYYQIVILSYNNILQIL